MGKMCWIIPEASQCFFAGYKDCFSSWKDESEREECDHGAFAAGEIQILVSTTVVEVGVNVPNATVMMVENASVSGWHSFISFAGVSVEGNISHIAFLCREWCKGNF